jgi:hypothetical protein
MANAHSTAAKTTAHLAGLARRIRDLEAVFSCGDMVTLPAPVTLQFGDGRRVRVVRENAWTRGVGRTLMARCRPAPFGVGRTTRRDRRVRDGGQLLAKDGALVVHGLDLEASGILAAIRRSLCPEDADNPAAELHALNVYGPGGHFLTHKDTPRDTDVFGTLVVCLPVSFRGGSLVLRHGSTHRFVWEAADFIGFGRTEETYPIQWAAFYSDVDHQVEPVTDGTRVTLTWFLRRTAAGQPRLIRRPVASQLDLEAGLAAALADPQFLPSGGTLGVPCTHLYAAASKRAPFVEALSDGRASALKGRDRLVAVAALRAGLSVRVRPYLFETCGEESWRLERPPTHRERGIFRRDRLGASELEGTMPVEHRADWSGGDDVTWVTAPPWMRSAGSGPARDAEPASAFLDEVEYSATGYFGNEGSYTAFYVSAALLLDVPPARRRAAKRALPGASTRARTPNRRRAPSISKR